MMQTNRKPLADGPSARSAARAGSHRSGPSGACSAGSSTMSPRGIASLLTPSPARLRAQRSPAFPISAGAVLGVDRTHTRFATGRTHRSRVADGDATRQHGAGHDRAGAGQREASVHREAEATRGTPCDGECRGPSNKMPRSVDAFAGDGRDRDYLGFGKARRLQARRDFVASLASGAPASTRSDLVSATQPRSMPSRSTIARCSRVCGITPSSAATTSNTKSMPLAPASMLCTKRSWPGTSTKPSDCAARRRQIGEAQVDRDAARLLFLQAVGIDARSARAPARSCRDRCVPPCR